jgi:hypothetical protein
MYGANGLRASELAAQLAELIEQHGDCRVIVGGGDYPEGCQGVYYNATERAYYPEDTFVVH